MAEFPAFPLWTDAYLGDTTHLTTLEHGAYLLLLISMWRTGDKCLPHDDKKLARYARLTVGQWTRIRDNIMPFFRVENGMVTQGRLSDEAEAVRRKSRKQSDRVKSRWLKNKQTTDTVVIPDGYRNDTSLTLTHTVSKETGADAPLDLKSRIWGPALDWLVTQSGKPKPKLRTMLGKWCSDYGDEATLSALQAAGKHSPIDPIPYIIQVLAKKPNGAGGGGYRPMGPGGG